VLVADRLHSASSCAARHLAQQRPLCIAWQWSDWDHKRFAKPWFLIQYIKPCRPNLGAKAFAAGWYFDFNLAYVGAGFITPISVSRLRRAAFSSRTAIPHGRLAARDSGRAACCENYS
jgi:hypothetical protein